MGVVSGVNYTFSFADGSTVTVYHQSWTNTLRVTGTTPPTGAVKPKERPLPGGHTAPRAVSKEELAVWNKVLALPDASPDLAAKGAPTSVTSQVVSGVNYTFSFADGSTVTVYHQSWTNTLRVTGTTTST